jgi:hypothetical protein
MEEKLCLNLQTVKLFSRILKNIGAWDSIASCLGSELENGEIDLSLLQSVQPGSGAHPASY